MRHRGAMARRDRGDALIVRDTETTEREVGRVADAVTLTDRKEIGVLGPRHVEPVLDGGDRRDGPRLLHLGQTHMAQAEMPNEALLPELGQDRETLPDRLLHRGVQTAGPQVDQIELVTTQLAQVAFHFGAQSRSRKLTGGVRVTWTAGRPNLRSDH